jgi:hypothetical protein
VNTSQSVVARNLAVALVAVAVAGYCAQAFPQSQQPTPVQALAASHDALANAPFSGDFPTNESAELLRDELYFQRAVQVYLWSLPAINMFAM